MLASSSPAGRVRGPEQDLPGLRAGGFRTGERSSSIDGPEAPSVRARAAARLARIGAGDIAIACTCAVVAAVGTIGADARWLPALGKAIVDGGAIPHGIPY